jgi:hypothetical protein
VGRSTLAFGKAGGGTNQIEEPHPPTISLSLTLHTKKGHNHRGRPRTELGSSRSVLERKLANWLFGMQNMLSILKINHHCLLVWLHLFFLWLPSRRFLRQLRWVCADRWLTTLRCAKLNFIVRYSLVDGWLNEPGLTVCKKPWYWSWINYHCRVLLQLLPWVITCRIKELKLISFKLHI